jgi:hypothetical protein
MAITNAQQYQQLVNKPANGKRPGYRGPGGYQSGQSDPSTGATGNIGGGGAPSPGDTGGEGGYNPSDNSTTQFGGGADNTGAYDDTAAKKQKEKEKRAEEARKQKAAADKKAAEAEAKQEKKEAKAKAKKDKKTKRMQKAAFDRFQKLEKYVDVMDDYGATGEELAKATGFKGNIETGFEYDKDFFRDSKTGKIKDQFTEMVDINKGKTDIFGRPKEPKFVEQFKSDAIPGYDFSIDPVNTNFESGLGTLTGTGGITPNDYGLQMSKPPGVLGLITDKVRPPTGLQAFNTLEEARNVQDFAGKFADGDDSAYEEFEDYVSRNIPTSTGGGGGNQVTDPCKGPNPPAYCNVGNDDDDDTTTPDRNLRGLAPRFGGSIFDFTGLADGGRAGYMDGGMMEDTPEGGIMDLESGRQMYFLGKLVKKATRAVKKIAKSPFGKAALLGLGAGMAGFGPASGLFGSGKGLAFKQMLMGSVKPGGMGNKTGGLFNFIKDNPYKSIFAGSTLLGLMGDKEDKGFDIDEYYRTAGFGGQEGVDAIRYGKFLAPRFRGTAADGGLMRMGYQEGGDAEPVAKKTMPLLDMDGMEKDYREDGGFVPIGRMERADDVPARLSKNEFVFTADAVRNAGEGDIDKGAEVMYNMMKNLESGGEVSEESQGLDGAREMFKTSQRLEEVL